jgi:thiosulfate/3-mercaptopyruvate sulfurtransferase
MPAALVAAAWAVTRANDPGFDWLDATYYLPPEGKDAAALFTDAHIPGAYFFDLDAVCAPDTELPHMLPPPEMFAQAVRAAGVSNDHHVIVYDQRGMFSAARLWWMFRVFGHDRVSVLDGGLPAWIAAGGATQAGTPPPGAGDFRAGFRPGMVRSLEDMRDNLTSRAALVLDARAAGRFDGSVPEPRPGMRGGHIPGSVSLPFTQLLAGGRMLPPDKLRARFAAAGVGDRPVITSCGSGVTAAMVTLAMVVAGLPEGALFDGSWSEWGARDDVPVER